jgi:tetratricopeptide (TPR) repeat protein
MIHLFLAAALLAAPGADELFKKGKAAFGAGNLTEALDAFTQARKVDKAPELLLNIAQCNRGLGRRAEAIVALESFLQEAPRHPLRKAAEGTLADLRAEQAAAVADTPARVELVPAPAPPAPIVVPAPQPPTRVWPWVGGAVAVAAVAAAIAAGLVVSNKSGHPELGTLHVPPPR